MGDTYFVYKLFFRGDSPRLYACPVLRETEKSLFCRDKMLRKEFRIPKLHAFLSPEDALNEALTDTNTNLARLQREVGIQSSRRAKTEKLLRKVLSGEIEVTDHIDD